MAEEKSTEALDPTSSAPSVDDGDGRRSNELDFESSTGATDEYPVDELCHVKIPTKIAFITGSRLQGGILTNPPRTYQIEMRLWMLTSSQSLLHNSSKKDNGIICAMPTGTGKTLCGAMTLLDYIIANPKKRAMFVVDKVPLCNQQAESLRCSFEAFGRPLKVEVLHGGRRCPPTTDFDVIVGVAESLNQCLTSKKLSVEMFCLVVIDEIHHAVCLQGSRNSRHPYYTLLNDHLMPCPQDTRPKIMGFTATPPETKCSQIPRTFSPSAVARVDLTNQESSFATLEEATGCLVRMPAISTEFASAISHPKLSFIEKNNESVEKWNNYVDWWEKNALDQHLKTSDQSDEKRDHVVDECTHLAEVISYIDEKSKSTNFRCVVFVKTVKEAKCLADILHASPVTNRFNPHFIVGHSFMKSWHHDQKPILESFHSGLCQLLVSTSVLEEGIDVQECNVVIRLDADDNLTLRSYIQSRGRARSKGIESEFVLVCNSSAREKIAVLKRKESEMLGTAKKYMKDYDEMHPQRSEAVESMFEKYQLQLASCETITFENTAAVDTTGLVDTCVSKLSPDIENLVISLYTYTESLSNANLVALTGAYGTDIILDTSTSIDTTDAPFQHCCRARCDISKWAGVRDPSSNEALFRFLVSLASKSLVFQYSACSSTLDYPGSCWVSYEGTLHGEKNSICQDIDLKSFQLGKLSSPSSFKSHFGKNSTFSTGHGGENMRMEFKPSNARLSIRFSVYDDRGLVWPRFQVLHMSTPLNAVAQIDYKDIVAVVLGLDSRGDGNFGSLFLTMRRPPIFFVEYDHPDGETMLLRETIPNSLKDHFGALMTYCVELCGSNEEQLHSLSQISRSFRHHSVPFFVSGSLKVTECERSNTLVKADGNFLLQAPFKSFESEYPWLIHQIESMFECIAEHYEDEMTRIEKSDKSFWSKQFSSFRLFRENFESIIFPTNVNKGSVLFLPIQFVRQRHSLKCRNTGFQEGIELSPEELIPPNCALVFAAERTPTRIVLSKPFCTLSNRILRAMSGCPLAENHQLHKVLCNPGESFIFLKLNIADEDFNEQNCNSLIEEIAKEVFNCGIRIGNTTFHLLHWSNSGLREKSVWMCSKYKPLAVAGQGPESLNNKAIAGEVTQWLGKLPDHVCKYASRFALAFSSTTPTVKIQPSCISVIEDIERNGFCFTDGCGQISPSLALKVSHSLGLPSSLLPSAYQVRFGGAKGVLVVNPHLQRDKIVLRKSQIKFHSNHSTIEVISFSKFNPAFLNQQIILLLSALGVADSTFLNLVSKALSKSSELVTDPKVAKGQLQSMGIENVDGARALSDPFLLSLLQFKYRQEVGDLVRRSRVFVEDGCVLLGVADDFGVLAEDEVFIQIDPSSSKIQMRKQKCTINSTVIVTKNPCLHPGDILRLKAVDRPEVTEKLGHLWNVIVFPTNKSMARPLPDMISGSDLDGDMYFVSWNDELAMWDNDRMMMAMDYAELENLGDAKPPQSLEEYFSRSCCGANLGVIANAHKVWADKNGAACEQCVELSKLHSIAVDFPKVGRPAEMRKELIPKEYPKWMNKFDKPIYEKQTILQKCSDLCPKLDINWLFEDLNKGTDDEHDTEYPEILGADYEEGTVLVRRYNQELQHLMRLYGLNFEAELFLGVDHHRGYSKRDRQHQNTLISFSLRKIVTKYKDIFVGTKRRITDCHSTKAVAWTKAAHDEQKCQATRKKSGFILSSFPWMVLHDLVPLDSTLAIIPNHEFSLNSSIFKSIHHCWQNCDLRSKIGSLEILLKKMSRPFMLEPFIEPVLFCGGKARLSVKGVAAKDVTAKDLATKLERVTEVTHHQVNGEIELQSFVIVVGKEQKTFNSPLHRVAQFLLSSNVLHETSKENVFPLLFLVAKWSSNIGAKIEEIESILLNMLFYILSRSEDRAPANTSLCYTQLDVFRLVESRPTYSSGRLLLGFFDYLKTNPDPSDRSLPLVDPLPPDILAILQKCTISQSTTYAASQVFHKILLNRSASFLCNETRFNKSKRFVFSRMKKKDQAFLIHKLQSILRGNGDITVNSTKYQQKHKLIIDIHSSDQLLHKATILCNQMCHQNSRSTESDMFLSWGLSDWTINLAILHSTEKILSAVKNNSVTILKAATGSGKSTTIPKLILNECETSGLCRILCFQPRRVAAVTLASHVAKQLQTRVGDDVGYQIGGDSNVARHTRIVYCTDAIGMLHCLQETLSYTHVVIDEVHMRSIFIDVAMAILKHYHLKVNKNLRVILMSASVNTDDLWKYFSDGSIDSCHVECVEGKTPFEIDLKYFDDIGFFRNVLPKVKFYPSHGTTASLEDDLVPRVRKYIESAERCRLTGNVISIKFPLEAVASFVKHIHDRMTKENNVSSKILVFLPGRQDILQLSMILDDLVDDGDWEIERLLGGVPVEQQVQIISSTTGTVGSSCNPRKIILCTDVLESSVTIPECDVVIDTLQQKRHTKLPTANGHQLITKFVSQDEALQRLGRTGRTKPGVVYRLLTKKAYDGLEKHPKPELLSQDITSVLVMLQELLPSTVSRWLVSSDIREQFCNPRVFLKDMVPSPPPTASVDEAYSILEELGAFRLKNVSSNLQEGPNLAPLGLLLKKLYFEPHSVLLILNGLRFGVLDEAITVASILQRGNPFLDDSYFEPFEKAAQLEARVACGKGKSDLMSKMNAFLCWRLNNNICWRSDEYSKEGDHGSLRQDACFVITSEADIKRENQWCWNHFLSATVCREIEEVSIQIYEALEELGCFEPRPSFLERKSKLRERFRKAKSTKTRLNENSWDKATMMENYRRLIHDQNLYCYFGKGDDPSKILKVAQREDILMFAIASSFPENTMLTKSSHKSKEVVYFSRKMTGKKKKRFKYKSGEEALLNFLENELSLPVTHCHTVNGKEKNELRHNVTFDSVDAATVAAQLRPGNEKYPYKRNDRKIFISGLPNYFGSDPRVTISQETVCDLKGENEVLAAKMLTLSGNQGIAAYLALDISVLPKNAHHAITASMHPFYEESSKSCRFKGATHVFKDYFHDKQLVLCCVKSIRNNLDVEFVSTPSSAQSDTRLLVNERSSEIIKGRQNNIKTIIDDLRQQSASEETKDIELELEVPSDVVGLIIGKKGSNIKNVEKLTGCNLHYKLNTSTIIITGKRKGVEMAFSQISLRARRTLPIRSDPGRVVNK